VHRGRGGEQQANAAPEWLTAWSVTVCGGARRTAHAREQQQLWCCRMHTRARRASRVLAHLILFLEAAQDLDGVRHRGLAHQHLHGGPAVRATQQPR
jgi:hypothetical protein